MKTYRQLSKCLFLFVTLLFGCHAAPAANPIQKTEVEKTEVEKAEEKKTEAAEATDDEKEKYLLSIEEKWGIKVLGIRPTAAGFMLNFRYKVVDAEKVSAFMGPRTKPYLIHQATGLKFKVPQMAKVGALFQRMSKAIPDRIYFALFDNPNMLAQSGTKVTVVIGDCEIKNLVVQ